MKCKACGNLIDYDPVNEYCNSDCMQLQKQYLKEELRELEELIRTSSI